MSVKRAAWRAQSIAQAFYKRRFIPTQKPSRTGNTSLRAALYMPSLVARRHNPILYRLAERLSATGMAKKSGDWRDHAQTGTSDLWRDP